MGDHLSGPLYFEQMGRRGPLMLFVHPNPMDQSCWIFQMAQLSTRFRCVAVDLPGYGRSPSARHGLTMEEVAAACWEVLDACGPGEPATLIGCSIGASVVMWMRRQHPHRTAALLMSGTGHYPDKEFVPGRIRAFRERGLAYRVEYTLEDFSPTFRATATAQYFADVFTERNRWADVDTIVTLFEAYGQPDPDDLDSAISCPTLIITGSEDVAHARAGDLQARIPDCALTTLPGAGHACHIEQPQQYNRAVTDFLAAHGLLPQL